MITIDKVESYEITFLRQMNSSSCQHLIMFFSQLAEVEKQQLLKQQQNQKNSKTVRELERINRVSTEAELLSNVT